MGMYTELIFGAELKEDTPNHVIKTLEYMIDNAKEKPETFPFPEGRCNWMLTGSSYYFGVNKGLAKMWYDQISKSYHISVRCNIKNYEGEIEGFLQWIKPYIEKGSGNHDLYAIVIYEDSKEPWMYYLLKD